MSPQMSYVVNPSRRSETVRRRFKLPVAWIPALVFLAISLLLIPLEFRARSAQNRTRKSVEAAWAAAQARGNLLSKKDLLKCLQGSYSREKTLKGECFVWQGALTTYPMQVEYRAGGMVQRVVWETPP